MKYLKFELALPPIDLLFFLYFYIVSYISLKSLSSNKHLLSYLGRSYYYFASIFLLFFLNIFFN